MSATEYNRWYIAPVVEVNEGPIVVRSPGYIYNDTRLEGYSGLIVDESAFTGTYDGLITQFPGQDWYIIRVYATGNTGYQALNEISANYQDTRTLATNEAFIVDVLKQRTNLSPDSIEDVENSFNIG